MQARSNGERGRKMTENTVGLREADQRFGVANLAGQGRDFGQVAWQRAGFEQQRPLATQ